MTIKPWKVLETKYLQPGLRVDRCVLPNGHIVDCQLLEYADEITVFALTKEQEVVLIRQYRHGVEQVVVELPGGSVDDGESPREAAKRELMEETGYSSETFIEVGVASSNPAVYKNKIYSFLALEAEKIGEPSDDAESIEVELVPLEDVISMAKKQSLIHSLNISTLFFVLEYLHYVSQNKHE